MTGRQPGDGRQERTIALVIAGAGAFWVLSLWLGPALGLPPRFAALIDLAVMGAFLWALIVTFGIWRKRRKDR